LQPLALGEPTHSLPAVLALNGHYGNAWQVLHGDTDLYWYGDAFRRRAFVVLAVDISHRPISDRRQMYSDKYVGGLEHGNELHPSIKSPGFDSDWEEDGER